MTSRTAAAAWAMMAAFSLTPAIAAEQQRPAQSLRDYALEGRGRYAFGLYLDDRKVGWAVVVSTVEEHDGQQAAVDAMEMQMAFRLLGQRETIQFNAKSVYQLSGDGVVVFAEEKTTDGKETTVATALRRGDRMDITTVVGGQKSTRTTPLSKDTLLQAQLFDRWLTAKAQPGDKIEQHTLDLDLADGIDSRDVFTFLKRRKTRWGGVPMQVARVASLIEGLRVEMEILADGTPVSTKSGPFDMRLEEEAIAKDFDAPVIDMLVEVPVDKRLGDPESLDLVVLECRGLGDFQFPTSHRQRVRRRGDATVVLELRRDYRLDKSSKQELKQLQKQQRKEYLRATAQVQSDHPRIGRLARRITGGQTDPVAAAGLLQRWVYGNLHRSFKANSSSALQVLANRAGDCTEHALLFVALARAVGIPARPVTGLMYADGQRPFFAWHEWAEIHDGSQWISVDPAWDQVLVDATHIRLQDGQQDSSWLNLMGGGLKLKVVEVKP